MPRRRGSPVVIDTPWYEGAVERSTERAQVAIVGGGLAGLATAWALIERGVRDLIVLEREPTLAAHASARNAAMCRALAEDDAWTALTAAGATILRDPPPSLAAGSLVDGRGAVLIARAAGARAEMMARAARHGVRCEVLPAALRGLADERDALWFPDDGVIDLAGLVGGLVASLARAGVRVRCEAEVEAVASVGGGVELRTRAGVVAAAVVVNAAGAWAGALAVRAGGVDPGYLARRRHVFALAVSAPAAPIVWAVDEGEHYTRPAGAETWASACDSEVTAAGDVSVDPAAADQLRARLPAALAATPIARTWACQRTFAPGGVPVIARDRDRPWLCAVTGLGGHGVTASLAIGRLAADVVDDALTARGR